ncbi:MAG: hypothetical protein RIG63_13215 [Coleofasciculus chthonoplastes F3-SA18-01]|jgi:hypothetical protein|uniref:hypothetical protein n=1 Tax=Coleofasciculus chthonoplastes TaxID=64178 RepID=UPI0032FDAFC5
MKRSIGQKATINVCSTIHCPFFDSQCSVSESCPKYYESYHCHLASVFAFHSDGHWLFTANEHELRHIQQVNDSWITHYRSILGQHGDRQDNTPTGTQRLSPQCDYPHIENDAFQNSPEMTQKISPISISLLDAIEFEDY